MRLNEQQRAELTVLAKIGWLLSAENTLSLLADLEEAEAGMNTLYDNARIEIARLQDELAATRQQLAEAQAYAYEQNAALRCAITQLCDCGRYLPSYDYQHIAEKSTPQDVLDYYLSEAVEQYKRDAERYRWLCADHEKHDMRVLVYEIGSSMNVRGKGSIDAAIDAAMSAKEKING